MRNLILFCCASLLFSSCRKDGETEFTSDVPSDFRTTIRIHFNEEFNTTTVYASFYTIQNEYDLKVLKLPTNSYLKINGTELNWDETYGYQSVFEGKPTCLIEFKNHDEQIYTNTIIPPDTAYFIAMPDTVSSIQGFNFQVNAPNLDNLESNQISLDSHGDDYGNLFFGTDTSYFVDGQYLDGARNHLLFFYRLKTLSNPQFPNEHLQFGGGDVQYLYEVQKSFYAE